MKHTINTAHTRSFEKAPKAIKGDVVYFEKRDSKNPQWFYGRDRRGVTGFFPVGWFEIDGTFAIARRDYDAEELTVFVGRKITVIERYGGWILVDDDGSKGWIPEEAIQ